jgi:hypothetical protein
MVKFMRHDFHLLCDHQTCMNPNLSDIFMGHSFERYNFRSIRQSDTETDGPTKCMLSDCYLCDCFVKYYVTLLTVLTNWGS